MVSTDHPHGPYTARSVCVGRQRTEQVRRVLEVHLHMTSVSREGRPITGSIWLWNRKPGGKQVRQVAHLSVPSIVISVLCFLPGSGTDVES